MKYYFQLSLLHPYHALNRRILHNKVCVATQTDVVSMPSTSSACQTELVNQAESVTPRSEQKKPMINIAPRIGKGVFPCRIGSCTVELPHGRIIGHLRYHHKDVYYEVLFNRFYKLYQSMILITIEFLKFDLSEIDLR